MIENKRQTLLRYVYALVGIVTAVALIVSGFLAWVDYHQRRAHSISVQYHHATVRLCQAIAWHTKVFEDEEVHIRTETLLFPDGIDEFESEFLPSGGDIEWAAMVIAHSIDDIVALQDSFADPDFEFLVARLNSYRVITEEVSSSLDIAGISKLRGRADLIYLTVDQLERMHLARDDSNLAEATGLLSHNSVLLAGIGTLLLGLGFFGSRRLLDSIDDLLGKLYLTHESLMKSKNRLSSIVEHAADGIITINEKGSIETFNITAERFFGYREKEAIGTDISSLIAEPEKINHEKYYRRYLDTGEKGALGERQEVTGLRKDGTTFPMDLVATRVELGDRHIFTAIVRDLTESKHVEAELYKLSKALNESSNEFYIVDVDTMTFTYVSGGTERALGYSKEELMSMTPTDIVASHSEEEIVALLRPLLAREVQQVSVEAAHRRKDGSTYPVEVHITCTILEGKNYFLGVGQDISDRLKAKEEKRLLESQVQQAQKLESLGVLAGGIAHDFNNLLVGVLGNAALSLKDLPPVSPVRDRMKQIESAATRAADLCRQMLAYSGKGQFVVRAVNINNIVEEMTHLLKVSISKNVVLNMRYGENLPLVEVDLTQVRQIIMNLITNASEAMDDKSGVIAVTTGVTDCDQTDLNETYLKDDLPGGTYVFVEVSDTGCGMDEDTIAKIFDPFFTTKFTGRGLGLAAVLGIIRGHSGALRVHSEPGKGATFRVLLPASNAPMDMLGDAPVEEEVREGSGTVLLVDDEEIVLTVGEHMLVNEGFDVLTAADGSEALDVFREEGNTIVCVILDLTMPRMNGEETFRELRRMRDDVPIIISSGYSEEDVAGRFCGEGLTGFVQKPYTPRALTQTVLRTLSEQTGRISVN